jgi:hypothetical protein
MGFQYKVDDKGASQRPNHEIKGHFCEVLGVATFHRDEVQMLVLLKTFSGTKWVRELRLFFIPQSKGTENSGCPDCSGAGEE